MDEAEHRVLGAVRELLPGLRGRVAEAEGLRKVPAASMKELQAAGVLRLLQPRRYGGHEAHPTVFYSAIKLIASACGSTGWVSSVLGVHPWHLALFPEAAQQEVWADDLDSVVSS